jgi:two-component system, cell cycle sensor histidine kinase and response regulator CckA
VAEELKQLFPELRVVFISGYTDDAVMRHGTLEPGTHFLQKPFSPLDLVRLVRQALDT